MAQKTFLTKESSPLNGSSPFNNSPRLFWREQTTSPRSRFDSENENEPGAPALSPKRSSIENLKKQSRVKNSSMFAREQKHEYDPTAVQSLDRPLAAGRPLSTSVQGNAYGGNGLGGVRDSLGPSPTKGHRRTESHTKIPMLSPTKASPSKLPTFLSYDMENTENTSPSEGRVSPTKSSLVINGRFNSPKFNPDSSVMSEDDDYKHQTLRPLRRHAKSVTFDTAPPTITEYEMVTPDPSAASGSREGSYESEEEEMSFDQDDSFDASLEDTEKTPVVLPEDWRHMSPEAANTSLTDLYDDVFDGRDNSPMPNAHSSGQNGSRRGSTNSDGESRPLPPLPGLQAYDERRQRDSSIGLSAAAERASDARRSLPQLPQAAGISKSDLLNMREGSMSLEDRLRLMNFDDDRDVSTPTQETEDKKVEQSVQVHVAEVDVTVTETELTINEPAVPRISRESILRRVKSRNFDDEYEDNDTFNYDLESSPERSYGDLADLDPDVPIPSRECSSNFDENPHQNLTVAESEADSVIDAYSFAEMTEVGDAEISQLEDYERESSVVRHPVRQETQEDDDVSEYSPQPEEQPTSQSTIDSSGPTTPTMASSPAPPEKQVRQDEMFASFDGEKMDLSLDPLKASFATALSPLDTAPKMDAMREFLRRPATPESNHEPEVESDEPGTPDSVIRHPTAISPPPRDSSPEVPQREATIRGAGGKLKTRPSLIPDEIDLATARRQVSGEHPPPVPVRSPKRQSCR
jgi:hypothetical protein